MAKGFGLGKPEVETEVMGPLTKLYLQEKVAKEVEERKKSEPPPAPPPPEEKKVKPNLINR